MSIVRSVVCLVWGLGLSLLACVTLAPAARAGAQNLLANPGFEAPLPDHAWMPAAWDTSRGNTEMVFFGRDAYSAHTGQYGISVANASASLLLWHNWSQSLDVTPDMWGKDMVFTIWTKSNGVDGRGYACLQAFRDSVGKMAREWKIDRTTAGRKLGLAAVNDPITDLAWQRQSFNDSETAWTQRSLRVYLPPSTNIITVRLGLFGTGQVLFDDASLTLEPAAPAVVPPLHTNLLSDPGFEGPSLGWELSTPSFPDFIAERDTTLSHTGKACMHFHCEAGLVSGRTGVAQVFCNRALAGKRLRLSGFAKADSLGSAIFMHLFFHTRSGFVRESTPQSVFGNKDWTKLLVEADAPEDTYAVWAWIEYTAPVVGHAYFDDLSLEVLGPATGQPTPGTIPVDARPAASPRPKAARSAKVVKPAVKTVRKK